MTAIGRSGLETPSYVFMTVFAAFVLLSIIVDRVKEYCLEWLSGNGREGLKAAFTTMVNEVMLLGFISLILTLVEESLSKLCVDEEYYSKRWIPIELVEDCDECFHHTRRLSEDFQWKQYCEEHEHGHSPPGHHHEEGHDDHDHHMSLRTLLSHLHASPVCKDGEVQFVSAKALHEVHTCIFLIAVVHVVVVALMVRIATLRVRWWKRCKREDDSLILSVDPETWEVVARPGIGRGTDPMPSGVPSTIEEETEPLVDVGSFNDPEQGQVQGETSEAPRERRNFIRANTFSRKIFRRPRRSHENGLPRTDRDRRGTGDRRTSRIVLPEPPGTVNEDTRPTIKLPATREQWTRAFWKQWFQPLNRNEIRILRCAFILEMRLGENFDFETYLLKSFDDDIGEIVKIPTFGWFGIIVGYTLWAPMRFSGWPVFLGVLALEVAVTVLCTKLVTIVLALTKDQKVHKLNEAAFWWRKPRRLFPLIRSVLFFNSVLFSLYLFVLWQYGAHSCALVEKIPGAGGHSILRLAGPLIFLVNLFCFLHTSWVLLPLYTVTVHLGSSYFTRHLLPPDVLTALHDLLERRRARPVPVARRVELRRRKGEEKRG